MGFGDAITLTTYTDYIDLQHQSGNLNTPPGSQVGAIWLTGSNVGDQQKSHIAFQTHLSSSGDISGNVFHGDGSKLSGITVSTFSGSKLIVTGKAIFSNAASLVTSGSISSSAGGTFLGAVIANTVQVSSSIMAAGALTVTGTISSSAEGGFHTLKSQAGATLTGSLINHGGVTLQGEVSSSGGAVFLGTVIANTVQVSSSIMAAGALTVTGTISSSAEGGFHTLKSQAGATLTGSLINHGGVTLQGEVSSSGGAVFLGTVIANTVQVSSSIMAAGALTVTGTISSSAEGGFHTLKSQAGSTLTGSLINHGAVTITNGTLSSSSPMVIEGTVTLTNAASLSTSGSVEAAGQISGAAGCVIGAGLTIANGDLSISGSAAANSVRWLGTPNKFLVSGSTFLSGTLDVGNGEPGVGFDVNFYGVDQAGVQTTGSFYWDASAEKLLFGSGSMIGVGLGTAVTAYAVHLPNIDGAAGQIKANAYITYSSKGLKTNIKTLENSIEKIKRLRGVTYNWKDSGNHDMGFIAEEVEKVVPEVVYSSKHNSDKGIDYSRITSLLVAAVKEQQDQIEELKALITDDN